MYLRADDNMIDLLASDHDGEPLPGFPCCDAASRGCERRWLLRHRDQKLEGYPNRYYLPINADGGSNGDDWHGDHERSRYGIIADAAGSLRYDLREWREKLLGVRLESDPSGEGLLLVVYTGLGIEVSPLPTKRRGVPIVLRRISKEIW